MNTLKLEHSSLKDTLVYKYLVIIFIIITLIKIEELAYFISFL